jgi:hypothetical protein
MHSDADRTSDRTLGLLVPDAAAALGISAEAVRARIKRGTLNTRKDDDGTVYVLLDADRARQGGDGTGDLTNAQALIIKRLENEVGFLRAELERKDHLLAAALERIPPALEEAPSEARESPESAGFGSGSTQGREEQEKPQNSSSRRSWWRRWFGA